MRLTSLQVTFLSSLGGVLLLLVLINAVLARDSKAFTNPEGQRLARSLASALGHLEPRGSAESLPTADSPTLQTVPEDTRFRLDPGFLESLRKQTDLGFLAYQELSDRRQWIGSAHVPAWAQGLADASRLGMPPIPSDSPWVVAVEAVQTPSGSLKAVLVCGWAKPSFLQRQKALLPWVSGSLALLALAGLAWLFRVRLLEPLEVMTEWAQAHTVGQEKDFEPIQRKDEMGSLSLSLQGMAEKLRTSKEEIARQNRQLEMRVQERTRQLMETVWELEEIRANLERVVQERTRGLEQSRMELQHWANTLEERVREKTQELRDANENLTASYRRLQELDHLKDEFLANITHELKTPLNAIIGFSGMLLQMDEQAICQDAKEDLGIIYQNGLTLLGMINSILELSKVEQGELKLELSSLDPMQILEEIYEQGPKLVGEKPILLRFNRLIQPVRVMADPQHLKQAFYNLFHNAIKFTDSGEVTLDVSLQDGRLLVKFRDTGVGMSNEEMARLFKPFQQVDGSITRKFGGAGLGLALSQRFITLLGGLITVESTKGKGSEFCISLPVSLASLTSPKETP